ncbi:MoaD/ThiS family protein [Aquimarina aquimarini]|uniref:MoaD/ThiS family protein n=1 Tax=Aquimarina aquimarini TaxID=1191734 RepID=UPI001F2759CF|nr:MoaD/ThiS family protein [Aquimarina aquimarini]
MELTIKYFGMLTEATAITEEFLQIDPCSVAHLVKQLQKNHPKLENTNFKVAINQELVDHTHMINTQAEIALLPPFAGG